MEIVPDVATLIRKTGTYLYSKHRSRLGDLQFNGRATLVFGFSPISRAQTIA